MTLEAKGEYIMIAHGILKGIKIYQTTYAHDDVIHIHPFVVAKMLHNVDQNEPIDIYKHSGAEKGIPT